MTFALTLLARAKLSSATSAVLSLEPSSTTITSASGICWFKYSKTVRSVSPSRAASLNAGITIEREKDIKIISGQWSVAGGQQVQLLAGHRPLTTDHYL